MNMRIGVSPNDKLPPAYRRAANLRRDLGRAVGLFGLGDRSPVVMRTLAAGKAAYDAIGERVPRPMHVDWHTWNQILNELKHQYGEQPYADCDDGSDRVAMAG